MKDPTSAPGILLSIRDFSGHGHISCSHSDLGTRVGDPGILNCGEHDMPGGLSHISDEAIFNTLKRLSISRVAFRVSLPPKYDDGNAIAVPSKTTDGTARSLV